MTKKRRGAVSATREVRETGTAVPLLFPSAKLAGSQYKRFGQLLSRREEGEFCVYCWKWRSPISFQHSRRETWSTSEHVAGCHKAEGGKFYQMHPCFVCACHACKRPVLARGSCTEPLNRTRCQSIQHSTVIIRWRFDDPQYAAHICHATRSTETDDELVARVVYGVVREVNEGDEDYEERLKVRRKESLDLYYESNDFKSLVLCDKQAEKRFWSAEKRRWKADREDHKRLDEQLLSHNSKHCRRWAFLQLQGVITHTHTSVVRE
jgi:hypothetical protein